MLKQDLKSGDINTAAFEFVQLLKKKSAKDWCQSFQTTILLNINTWFDIVSSSRQLGTLHQRLCNEHHVNLS